MNYFAVAYLLSFLVTIVIGVFILVRNPRSHTNRVFFVLSIFIALVAYSQFEFVKAESAKYK